MNELREAEIYYSKIEKNYTCLIGLNVLRKDKSIEFMQSFGGSKFNTDEDYNMWKNAIENMTGRRFEDIHGAHIKTVVSFDDMLGIGSLKGNNWITKKVENKKRDDGTTERRTIYSFLNTKKEIDEFFESVGIEQEQKADDKSDIIK